MADFVPPIQKLLDDGEPFWVDVVLREVDLESVSLVIGEDAVGNGAGLEGLPVTGVDEHAIYLTTNNHHIMVPWTSVGLLMIVEERHCDD